MEYSPSETIETLIDISGIIEEAFIKVEEIRFKKNTPLLLYSGYIYHYRQKKNKEKK
jgi:hypothetical protein